MSGYEKMDTMIMKTTQKAPRGRPVNVHTEDIFLSLLDECINWLGMGRVTRRKRKQIFSFLFVAASVKCNDAYLRKSETRLVVGQGRKEDDASSSNIGQ